MSVSRRSIPALVTFLFVLSAFVLAGLWGYALLQQPAAASPQPMAVGVMPPMPKVIVNHASVVATESQDAARAGVVMAHTDLPLLVPASLPAHRAVAKNGLPSDRFLGRANIAIIIDDMGLNRRNSHRVMADLPPQITLSYLPYADDIQAQVDQAKADGHEIMLHLPMEPLDRSLYPGPRALTTRLSRAQLVENTRANLQAFTGYVGVNNHMGSRLTSSPDLITEVLREVEDQGVYFVDSWTSPRSVAYQTAASIDIPRARRDVFLDHDEGADNVWVMLRLAEQIAHRQGSAVVIGHPKNDTIRVLKEWVAGVGERGITLVPVSQVLYDGDVGRDPVLLADQARRHRLARNADGPSMPR